MQGRYSARKRAGGYFAIFGIGGLAGFLLISDQGLAQTAGKQTAGKELSPAQVVAHRFPAAWNTAKAEPARPVTHAYKQPSLFDPNPTYALASADSQPVMPKSALAYADPEPTAAPKAAGTRAAAVPLPRPAEKRVAKKPDNHILNDAQIASIRTRLNLTPDQQRQWPAVEQALRGIAYKMNKSKLASIDPNSAEVQYLKESAIPLLMTFNDSQKSEVRQLAYVMGLEKLAQAF